MKELFKNTAKFLGAAAVALTTLAADPAMAAGPGRGGADDDGHCDSTPCNEDPKPKDPPVKREPRQDKDESDEELECGYENARRMSNGELWFDAYANNIKEPDDDRTTVAAAIVDFNGQSVLNYGKGGQQNLSNIASNALRKMSEKKVEDIDRIFNKKSNALFQDCPALLVKEQLGNLGYGVNIRIVNEGPRSRTRLQQ